MRVILFTLLTLAAVLAPRVVVADELLEGLRLQIALDRLGFSPGVIDGKPGRKTQLAMKNLAQSRGVASLTAADVVPADMPTLVMYTVTAADLADVGAISNNWNERAAAKKMTYPSLGELLAERGHCTKATVARLNENLDIDYLKPGESVALPAVLDAAKVRVTQASALVVDLNEKVVYARDPDGKTLAMFHCSIAAKYERRPKGATTVKVVAFDPDYTFDPAMWPEVKNVDHKLRIPPGPRNPVGLCWVGLDLPGYGIHGTPWPELIGKTGSHGCIRLANWDAIRLGRMVTIGMPVQFRGSGEQPKG
jgi:lipoprotein-anchoring transpeptidase ErfK/SrfK